MLSRRHFLQLVVPLAFTPSLIFLASEKKHEFALIIAKLHAVSNHHVSAAIVGNYYLNGFNEFNKLKPIEEEVDIFINMIAMQRSDFIYVDNHKLQNILSDRIQKDFEHNRLESVDGWMLSQTEVAICRIIALTHHSV